MSNTNYVRDGNVFEWNFNGSLKGNDVLSIVIDPNNVNVNIFELIFPKEDNPSFRSCAFYEGVEDVNESISQTEPLAHNLSLEVKSGVKFKTVNRKLSYERKLFTWKEYSKWNRQQSLDDTKDFMNKNNYNTTGWILNKKKKYAFLIENNYNNSNIYEIFVSMLWNEYL